LRPAIIYDYFCSGCAHEFEVIKRLSDIDRVEHCPKCDKIADRTISKYQAVDGMAAASWNQSRYCPATGKHMTPMQLKKHAKAAGWTEVGNESPDKIFNKFEKDREEKHKRNWDEINTNLGEIK